jgi:hypothetical protein
MGDRISYTLLARVVFLFRLFLSIGHLASYLDLF